MAKKHQTSNVNYTKIISLVGHELNKEYTGSEIREVLDAFLTVIEKQLYEGRTIPLHRLGTFDTKLVPPQKRELHLPRAKGRIIDLPAMFVPTFKFSKSFKDKIKVKKAFYEKTSEKNA